MLTLTLKGTADVENLERIITRHKASSGFCVCCIQPWPCDVQIIRESFIAKEW